MKKSTKNYIIGSSSIIDIVPSRKTKLSIVSNSSHSISRSLAGDWAVVGATIKSSMSQVSKSNGKSEKEKA